MTPLYLSVGVILMKFYGRGDSLKHPKHSKIREGKSLQYATGSLSLKNLHTQYVQKSSKLCH